MNATSIWRPERTDTDWLKPITIHSIRDCISRHRPSRICEECFRNQASAPIRAILQHAHQHENDTRGALDNFSGDAHDEIESRDGVRLLLRLVIRRAGILRNDSCGVRTHAISEWRLEPPP